jgi:hypothetical protein
MFEYKVGDGPFNSVARRCDCVVTTLSMEWTKPASEAKSIQPSSLLILLFMTLSPVRMSNLHLPCSIPGRIWPAQFGSLVPSFFPNSTLLLPCPTPRTDVAGTLHTAVYLSFPLPSTLPLFTNNSMLSTTPPSNNHRYPAS